MPNLQLERSEGCNPLIMTYDAGTKNEAVITTYDFGNNRVFQQRDSITPVKYSLDAPGTYTLRIYSKGKNGCSGVYEYPYPLVVYPTPGSDVAWSPEIPTTTDDITFQPSSKVMMISNLTTLHAVFIAIHKHFLTEVLTKMAWQACR